MEHVNAIREILGYAERFKDDIVVINIDDGLLDSLSGISLSRDFAIMDAVGMKLLIIYSGQKTNLHDFLVYHEVDLETILTNPILMNWPIMTISRQNNPEIIAEIAVKLSARKLIFITRFSGIYGPDNTILNEIKLAQIPDLLNAKLVKGENKRYFINGRIRHQLIAASMACEQGVERVHFISGKKDGALLKEIFSCEGVGTMIRNTDNPYGEILRAKQNDAIGIYELLKDSDFAVLSDDQILAQIERFIVFSVDNDIFGCACLSDTTSNLEVNYLAISEAYANEDIIAKLLEEIENIARKHSNKQIIITPKNWPWIFVNPILDRMGFIRTDQQNYRIKNLS